VTDVISRIINDRRFRYLLVGGTSVILEYISFLLLIELAGLSVVMANIISFLVGFIYTFVLHNRWTFFGNHEHNIKSQFAAYTTLAVINVVATSLLINLQVTTLHIAPFIAKLVCMALVVVWNYLLLSRLIFKIVV
jgi:putative flippase GtrA